MDNISLVKSWLKLALSDWEVIRALNPEIHRGATVFHAQQFVEKLCKGIIASLGFEPPKTHEPSKRLDEILFDIKTGAIKLNIDANSLEILERISSMVKTFEDERTRPRYGIRHFDRIIPPDEYYSSDYVISLIKDAKYIAKLVHDFLKLNNICSEMEEVCGELSAINEE